MVANVTGVTGTPQAADVTLQDVIQQPLQATQGANVITPDAVQSAPITGQRVAPLVPPGFEILGDNTAPIQPLTTPAGRALVSAIKEVLRG